MGLAAVAARFHAAAETWGSQETPLLASAFPGVNSAWPLGDHSIVCVGNSSDPVVLKLNSCNSVSIFTKRKSPKCCCSV